MKFLLILTLIITQHLFALVTIIPVEIGENPGFSSTIEAELETKKGNSDTDSYKASARVTYDSDERYVTWSEISGAYERANREENTNKLFLHTRYIHAITEKTIRYELFGQLQNDKFKEINSRALAGGGLRFRLFELFQNSKGYFGVGAFYENIRYENRPINPSEDNLRLNSYFAYSIDLTPTSSLAYTLYYQPKIDDISDDVQSHEIELKVDIYKNLSLKFAISYETDTNPPSGVGRYDFTQNTSLLLKF